MKNGNYIYAENSNRHSHYKCLKCKMLGIGTYLNENAFVQISNLFQIYQKQLRLGNLPSTYVDLTSVRMNKDLSIDYYLYSFIWYVAT